MAISEAQKRAQRKYNDTHQRQIKFSFSIQNDADILTKLDAIPNKQGYIKELIRADIAQKGTAQNEKEEKTMKFCVEFTDNRTGATSPIDNIEAKAGYTADDYIRDCRANADADWCEMLDNGTVTLVPVED